ncbi:potassium-transporting ATPase subunit KdpC [Beijerinckia indica]|uniref:Potassium-transporting ATPase KdpC subunit n=1 Tax=Beijerinckia indica subsp. indica (strain ATCC 9039 / DSM 1715 / NCIMB 8712) TaxID=395963 RepID=KDPC_BEII9|nr:potassium-transporting ATPase subunit KdpC [Beijerinckia indica]B2IIP7.1 RecName: Full=Potassium-transporting ATPase KdpC subunit; AltName: Full=ATP phosphohydrolase [potassium-transporting] C chain; AltName: Full=Potassium-binding and translocating subunit C; AltName: Full=Potassium-translocating ATPase C chain [Beijerinckia indica subsp. indica ATCC 9039]ACB94740.1 potassium-transporting ATPase, C subunit [Beijerinckia indica subsp. indica ATCC 9039]
MLQHIRPAFISLILFTLLFGLIYPLTVTGIAQFVFPDQASGSLIFQGDQVVGSRLIGQAFHRPEYLHPRPSIAGDGYDASASSGSNLGPLNPDLVKQVTERAAAIRVENQDQEAVIPADAVTASGSGLDPEISPAYAGLQAKRVASARAMPVVEVERIVAENTQPAFLGFIGQPRVNVLAVNLALDARFPIQRPPMP